MGRVVAACLAFALCVSAADKKKSDPSAIGQRKVDGGPNLYSLEKEIALGKQLAQEVQRQAKMFDDPLVGEYVNRLGQNIARNSDVKVPCTFRIIDDEILNAFALPGGYIFINTGLIKVAETEAELVSAMAHEVAHVAARHMTRQATQRQIVGWLSNALLLIGGWTGYAARQGAGIGIPVTFLSFGRAYESEADYLGLQYTYAAGYDPTAAIDLFERMQSLQKKRPGTISKVFATHPMDGDRARKTQEEIGKILPAKPEYVITTSEYNQVRERLFALQNQRKAAGDDSRPVLRVAPGAGSGQAPETDDQRPTIKRREWVD